MVASVTLHWWAVGGIAFGGFVLGFVVCWWMANRALMYGGPWR